MSLPHGNGIQTLETYRLVQGARSLSCYLCGMENSSESEFCTHCLAPMALGRHFHETGETPSLIAMLGMPDVGKTVYMSLLMDMLSRDRSVGSLVFRGGYSLVSQQEAIQRLSRCQFPQHTERRSEDWSWTHCCFHRMTDDTTVDMIFPDPSGHALLEELQRPHSHKQLRGVAQMGTAAMLLVDAQSLAKGCPETNYTSMQLLSLLADQDDNRMFGPARDQTADLAGWSKRPLAILLTKTERCEAAYMDPEKYIAQRAPGLWDRCREHFDVHKYFAARVSGTCIDCQTIEGRQYVPLRIEPHGIVEPFYWILDQIKELKRKSKKGLLRRLFAKKKNS